MSESPELELIYGALAEISERLEKIHKTLERKREKKIYLEDLLVMLSITIGDAMEHFNNPLLKEIDETELKLEKLIKRLKEEKPKIYRYMMNRPFLW